MVKGKLSMIRKQSLNRAQDTGIARVIDSFWFCLFVWNRLVLIAGRLRETVEGHKDG